VGKVWVAFTKKPKIRQYSMSYFSYNLPHINANNAKIIFIYFSELFVVINELISKSNMKFINVTNGAINWGRSAARNYLNATA
jgi:hypothetical protein